MVSELFAIFQYFYIQARTLHRSFEFTLYCGTLLDFDIVINENMIDFILNFDLSGFY